MPHKIKNISKETEIIKNYQMQILEQENTKTEKKYIHWRALRANMLRRISKLENRLIGIIDFVTGIKEKKNEESQRVWHTIKCTNIFVIGVSGVEKKKNVRKIFEKIIAD